MNWNQLRYVISIVESGSITEASKKMYISQPSLSLSIQSLEKELGTKLFSRTTGRITLTYAGQVFYEWAIATLHSQKQLLDKVKGIAEQSCHLITIGISPHRTSLILPEILRAFYDTYPNSEINIIEQPTYILRKELEQGKIDIIIDVPHPDSINFRSEILTEEKIILAIPVHFLSKIAIETGNSVSLRRLIDFPFIMLSSEHVIGAISRKICESDLFYPNSRLTCSNIESALKLADQQLGITFVPEIYKFRSANFTMTKFFEIANHNETRKIALIYPYSLYQHEQLKHLIELFRLHVPKLYR